MSVGLVAANAATYYTRDPLTTWRFSSPTQRSFWQNMIAGHETLFRTGNIGGKTTGGGGFFTSVLEGQDSVDARTFLECRQGVAPKRLSLPVVPMPARVLLLVPAYKSEGAVEAVLKVLGEWPHKVREVSAAGAVGVVYIRPRRSHDTDVKKWSRLIVFSDKGTLPKGLRVSGIWSDEIVSHAAWSEARFRRIPGQPFFRGLTVTPREPRHWKWLRADFPAELDTPVNGRVHLNMRADENQMLSPNDLEELRRSSTGDPYWRAKLFGDFVVAGDNPLDPEGLMRWEDYAEPGERGRFEMVDGAGRWIPDPSGDAEKWDDALPGETCWIIADSSMGLAPEPGEPSRHDPSAMWACSWNRRKVLARYHGYQTPAELSRTMEAAGWYYNEGELIPECNNESGGAVIALLAHSGYPNIYREERLDRTTGAAANVLGWHTTTLSRGKLIAALQDAVKRDLIDLPSLAAIESLRQVVVNDRERIEAGAGHHDEDMICGGIFCYLLSQRGDPESELDSRPRTIEQALADAGEFRMDDMAEDLTLG